MLVGRPSGLALAEPPRFQPTPPMTAKSFALAFGVAVIFPLLVHYGVCTFSPEPRLQDFEPKGQFDFMDATRAQRREQQAERTRANTEWQEAHDRFELHLFAVAAPLGAAAILCGAFLRVQAIGAGLIFGGVFSVLNGYIRYWSNLPNGLRFSSLLVAFAVLVFVGYKKLDKSPA
jgi:hypothetical protein